MSPLERRHKAVQYRRTHLRLSVVLMTIWALVSFVVPFFARELDFMFLSWPFSFWMAAQGAILIYLVIVWVYAHRMNQLDDQHHQPPHDNA